MRRFEFKDGSSNKFWEIQLDDCQFTLRWGKIGTAGQSQTKSFPTAQKTLTEHDKLIKEKTSKGYLEVGAAAPPAPIRTVAPVVVPTVAPEPSPAAAPPSRDGTMHLSDSQWRKVLPWRGGAVQPPRIDMAKVKARLSEVRNLDAQRNMDASACHIDQEHLGLLQERVGAPVDQPPRLLAQVEACFMSLMGCNDFAWDRIHEIGADLVHLWCEKSGPVLALQALLLNFDYGTDGQLRDPKQGLGFFPYLGPWRALRGYLAFCDESVYRSALELARPVFQDGHLDLRVMLAVAFSEENDLVEAVAHTFLKGPFGYKGLGLLASVRDPAVWAQMAEKSAIWLGQEFSGIKPMEFVPTGVARLRVEALPGLLKLAELATKVGDKKALAEWVAAFQTPVAAAWLTARSQDKAIGPVAAAYLQSHPELGASSPPKAAPAGPLASAEELPAILVTPPWLQPAPKKKPAAQRTLEPLPFAEKEHFPAGRREKLLRYVKPHREPKRSLESCHGFAESLCNMPDPEWALELWNTTPASAWNQYSMRSTWEQIPSRILASFGCASIPGLLTNLSIAPNECYQALAMAESPRAAVTWAEAFAHTKKYRAMAQKWFKTYPRAAAVGLIPAALASKGKAREAVESSLRWLASQGEAPLILEVAELYAAKGEVEDILSADPLQDFPPRLPTMPSWWRPAALQAPQLKCGKPLPSESVGHIGMMLALSTIDRPYAGLGLVMEACDPASLESFAWSIYQAWLVAGGPAREDWGFFVLGYFGGDETARRLTPEIRRWPAEGLSTRAAVGLDVLCLIGTDVALMHLHSIAQKVRHKALQEKAQAKIQEIADNRGLTLDELADRLVPDLDLEPDGSRLLDFGPRSFRVGFDEFLRPFVKDAQGKPLGDLPKPLKSDDAEKANLASEIWKALKKDAKTVALTQLARLEQGLALRRRWTGPVFQELLARHPLLSHVTRRLVWGVYEGDRLLSTFRVAEDGTLANNLDQEVPWRDEVVVGLFHPLDSVEEIAPWRKILLDYAILQPFPQIARTYHRATPEEEEGIVKRFVDKVALKGRILRLEGLGWRRGSMESGAVTEYMKNLSEGVATLQIIAEGGVEEMGQIDAQLELLQVPPHLHPVEFSEVIQDVERCLQG